MWGESTKSIKVVGERKICCSLQTQHVHGSLVVQNGRFLLRVCGPKIGSNTLATQASGVFPISATVNPAVLVAFSSYQFTFLFEECN
jgi:hypothetical protein